MAYIYRADVWCDTCGEKIIAKLTKAGKAPSDPQNESSYDSDKFPKYYDAKSEKSDGPENCADGSCGGSYEYKGRKLTYGTFLRNQLTPDGYDYLRELLSQGKPTLPAQEWAEFYKGKL